MQVMLKIEGTQTVDDETDSIELTTAGTMEETESGFTLRYRETEATGMEKTDTTLQISDHQVILERAGGTVGYLVLEKGRRHHSNYQTPYGSIDLGTYASDINIRKTENGYVLYFAYTLGFNSSVHSSHTVTITVQEDKTNE